MRAKSLDGQTVNLDFTDGTPTVLYYLSPACVWCNRNYPNIRTLASQRSGSYPFVGVARGSDSTTLRDYLEQRPLSFEVYLVPDREWLSSHGLAGTPAMILIDGGGRVTRVWNGALMLERLAEVEEVFGVKLPGVESVSQ